jgi:hypothetical protein
MYMNAIAPSISIIAREKLTGLGQHWGVALPNDHVAHNTDDKGPHVVTLEEFAAGNPIWKVREVPLSEHNATLQRIQQELSAPMSYDLLKNNCETFANRVTGYVPESPSVKGVGFIFGLVTLTVLLAKTA